MIKKYREFDKKYSTLFFCISLLIIIIFLAYFSTLNKSNEEMCTIPNNVVNNYNNYSYEVKYTKDEKNIDLFVKRYDKKYLIEKEEDGVKNMYYIYYTDILEKASNGKYIRFRNNNIIDNLDNKLLLLEYVNDVSLESSITEKQDLTCYINRKKEISMCINLDESITLKGKDYSITYTVKEVGTVKDFNVDVDLDDNNSEDIDNSYVQ